MGIFAESVSATVEEFQQSLVGEGFHAIYAMSVGGDSIHLSSSVGGAVADTINSKKNWWNVWFRSITGWSSSCISNKRRVWLSCLGVSLHVWRAEIFTSLGNKFGKFLDVDNETATNTRFDVARIRVLVSSFDVIDQKVIVSVGGGSFPVVVLEERFEIFDGRTLVSPQRSTPVYSSGSDECNPGVGEFCGCPDWGFGEGLEDGDDCVSDGR